jgi:hypothetical protein
MSMEMHVLFRGTLPGKAALARTIRDLGFPFLVLPLGGSLEQQTGFMPMRFRGEETGVEFDVFNSRTDVEDAAGDHIDDVDPSFDRSANFRWGGDDIEMVAGMCAAAALAKLTNGIVIEEAEGLLLTPDEAASFARKHLEAVAQPQNKHRGTRPADIKRYLKSLLKQRGDLALVGRLLVIRPVRHLLRGALLDRTSDKYSFRIWKYLKPAYADPRTVGYGDYIGVANCPVWQPHFEPLLIDALAEDIFDQVGRITTLAGLADAIDKNRFIEQRITSLILAGERDRAAEYVDQIERNERNVPYAKNLARRRWDRVSHELEAVCAECHAKEAETIKALKLEHIWEPSPFPVELPAAERIGRTAEPVFPISPWISRPSWLLQDAPEELGELRFAKDILHRHGGVVLLVPLTREDAEQRHNNLENYVLAVRLPEGGLFLIRRFGRDRNDPEVLKSRPDYRPSPHFIIELYGSSYSAQLLAWQDETNERFIEIWSIDIFERPTRKSDWHYFASLKEDERTIHDSRTGEMIYSKTPLTSAERDLIQCPMPAFGEYTELAARVRSLLRTAGYGELT